MWMQCELPPQARVAVPSPMMDLHLGTRYFPRLSNICLEFIPVRGKGTKAGVQKGPGLRNLALPLRTEQA